MLLFLEGVVLNTHQIPNSNILEASHCQLRVADRHNYESQAHFLLGLYKRLLSNYHARHYAGETVIHKTDTAPALSTVLVLT